MLHTYMLTSFTVNYTAYMPVQKYTGYMDAILHNVMVYQLTVHVKLIQMTLSKIQAGLSDGVKSGTGFSSCSSQL